MILHCIALRTVRYSDRQSIVSAWTSELGRVGIVVPAGSTREARRRRALMMPMGVFEGVSDVRPGRDLIHVRDVRPWGMAPDLTADPAKAATAMFVAEILERVLRESPPDEIMTQFIYDAVCALDGGSRRFTANFPIWFLYRLGTFLGIAPDEGEWIRGMYFDMADGRFRSSMPVSGRYLDPAAARYVPMLAAMDRHAAARMPLTRAARREILEQILEYYTLHHSKIQLATLPILSELF